MQAQLFEPFLIIGLILFAGFAANLIFTRTRVSQVLVLIAVGFLIGPALHLLDVSNGSGLAGLVPFAATLALVILVFDGGITLNVFELVRALPKATVFMLAVFIFSLAATAAMAMLLFNWGLVNSLLLGCALAGTSFEVVWAMLKKAEVSLASKSILALESTFTDDLSIIATVTLLHVIKSGSSVDAASVANMFAASLSVALIAGAICAVAWLGFLRKLSKDEFPYVLTLAAVFLVYALVEKMGANGGIAVFIFALILGNARRWSKLLKTKGEYKLDSGILEIQGEVTFFTTTFFLVLLGLIMKPESFTLELAGFSAAVTLVFVAIRWACRKTFLSHSQDANLIVTMLPRGLAAAVLAGLPAAEGVVIPGFAEIALLVIVFTNVIATIGVFASGKSKVNR